MDSKFIVLTLKIQPKTNWPSMQTDSSNLLPSKLCSILEVPISRFKKANTTEYILVLI